MTYVTKRMSECNDKLRSIFSDKKVGNDGGMDTPVPFSNTEVKHSCADGTWRAAAWESRTLPAYSKVAQWWSNRLLTGRLWVRVPPLEP